MFSSIGRRATCGRRFTYANVAITLALVASTLAAAPIVGGAIVPAVAAAEGSCENEARRVEQASTFLPDCRAYELVSQPYQPAPFYYHYVNGRPFQGTTPFGEFGEEPQFMPKVQSDESIALNGDAVLYGSDEPNSGGDGINNDLSRRGAAGWAGENIEPKQSTHGFLCGVAGYIGASQNLEQVLFKDGQGEVPGQPLSQAELEACGHDEPRLVPGESEVSANVFLRDTATGAWQLVNPPQQPGSKPHDPWGAAVSPDGSNVVFQSKAQLTPDAPFVDVEGNGNSTEYCENEFGDVYVWSAGAVHLLTVLPDGKAARGTLAGAHPFASGCDVLPPQSALITHSVSANGVRMLFYAGGGFKFTPIGGFDRNRPDAPYIHGGLYLREHPGGAEESAQHECTAAEQTAEPEKACSVRIDVPESGAPTGAAAGGGQFQWANAETTKIFFTDDQPLVEGATAAAGKSDLYEYDVEKPEGKRLTDLTVNTVAPADVLGVSGASEDGSYVYFVAEGVLTGSQQNSHGDTALAPVAGSGTLSGVATGTGTRTQGSNQVTGLSVESGEFHVGQEIEGEGLPSATTVTACTPNPNCSAPSGLTLSQAADVTASSALTGRGSKVITGVNATSGAFHAGMTLTGSGISHGTWITQVGVGTLTLSRGVAADGTQALSATAGNLYLRHDGTTTFVAALSAEVDQCDWTTFCLTSRVSRNGLFIAFDSIDKLTGYENEPVHPEACSYSILVADVPCMETFRYSAAGGANGELTCASCNPSGAPPASEFAWAVLQQAGRRIGAVGDSTMQATHAVSDSGQVFFETMEKLVPADENETWDVYQYDGGEGAGAQFHLISSGTSPLPSYFIDATPDGSNVFFLTAQSLLRADTRNDYDLYDARVGGGFAAQNEPVAPPPCTALEGCRSPLSEPPAELSAGSASLFGSGNLVGKPEQPGTCTNGKALRHGRCVKRPHKRGCPKGGVRHHGRCVTRNRHHRSRGRRTAGK